MSEALARQILTAIVTDGLEPPVTELAGLGDYRGLVQPVVDAYRQGSTTKARQVWTDMARGAPNISALVAAETSRRQTGWTIDQLLNTQFPEPVWAVPNIIPVGLTVLAGRPKLGKSWLALQTAVAVSVGGIVLDQRVEQGAVLYLALEDSPRRLQDRLRKMHASPGGDATFETEWESLKDGGLARLSDRFMSKTYRLVVIDTISRALGRSDQMDAAEMTQIMGELQTMALFHNLALLLIDHHRKLGPDGGGNPIDDILGSTAKGAVVDSAIGLYRKRNESLSTLAIIGREVPEQNLSVVWDSTTACWQLGPEGGDPHPKTLRDQIIEAFGALEHLGQLATTRRLAEYLDKAEPNISRELAAMLREGLVRRLPKQNRQQPYELVRRAETSASESLKLNLTVSR